MPKKLTSTYRFPIKRKYYVPEWKKKQQTNQTKNTQNQKPQNLPQNLKAIQVLYVHRNEGGGQTHSSHVFI